MKISTQLIFLGVIGFASVDCCDTTSKKIDGATETCELCYTASSTYRCTFFVLCDQSQMNNCTDSRKQMTTNQECSQKCCSFPRTNTSLFNIICKQEQPTDSTNYIIAAMVSIFAVTMIIGACAIYYKCCKNRKQNIKEIALAKLDKVDLTKFKLEEVGKLFLYLKENCSICLQDQSDVGTQCSHCFHYKCLQAWIHKSYSCPYCKSVKINPIKQYCISCGNGMRLFNIQQQTSFQSKDKQCKSCAEQVLESSVQLNRKEIQHKSIIKQQPNDPFFIN